MSQPAYTERRGITHRLDDEGAPHMPTPIRDDVSLTPPLIDGRPAEVTLPNLAFDQMLNLTEAELKVLLFIVRQTLGYTRDTATLTYINIAYGTFGDDGRLLDRGTGLCQKSIGRAVKLLNEKGYIETKNIGRQRYAYSAADYAPTGTTAIYSLGMRMRPPRRWID